MHNCGGLTLVSPSMVLTAAVAKGKAERFLPGPSFRPMCVLSYFGVQGESCNFSNNGFGVDTREQGSPLCGKRGVRPTGINFPRQGVQCIWFVGWSTEELSDPTQKSGDKIKKGKPR